MTTGAAYQYRPLRYPDSVRILHLKPSLSGDDPIHCTLTTYRLSDPGLKYEPVSYTWGDASDVVDIYIGGNRAFLSVTRHCFNALTSLRLRDTPRHLWIDAICINQEDKVERSAQVQIMDQVYARGFRTLIYLGEATQGPGTDLLFDDLEKADREGFDRPVPGPEIVEQLERLIERPWFHRVWVVQEAFLNSERVVICGRRQASWDALESCLFGYLRSGNRVTQAPLPAVVYAAIEGWWSDIGCVWLNLFNSLNETRPLLASNPRDRIFALKALLGRDQDRLNPLIDYRRSVPDLLADVARQILDAVGLIILDAIQEPHKQPMASWIPDWTRVEHPIFNWTLGIRMYSDEVEEVPLKSPEREYHYKFSILPGTSPSFAVLKVHGWRLGPTLVMGKPFSFKDLDDVRRQLWPLLEHLHNLHQAGKPWQPLDEAFDPTGHFPPPIQRGMLPYRCLIPT
ncbi:HET-domain-containing protein [Echria macrotheca]|uniref:HET-domain-containing protein n=1 Tax=Echria macrotheca TaxID=438768 RepID=A0AAJ0FCV3_9PEZI|nr:HET-domain-containing protein [Echria macrotheca]